LKLTEDHKSFVVYVADCVTPLLHYIPTGIPEYTDHGFLHSINVLRNIRDIVHEYPVKSEEEEKLILTLSTVLHDLGCIVKRKKHNERTIKILSKSRFDFLRFTLGKPLYRALEAVITAHSGEVDLGRIPDDPCPEIRLKLTIPIFRLADACDITSRRVKELLLQILVEEDLLNKKSKHIWRSHLEIENILVRGTQIRPQIYDRRLARYSLAKLSDELRVINKILSKHSLPIFTLEPDIVERSILKRP